VDAKQPEKKPKIKCPGGWGATQGIEKWNSANNALHQVLEGQGRMKRLGKTKRLGGETKKKNDGRSGHGNFCTTKRKKKGPPLGTEKKREKINGVSIRAREKPPRATNAERLRLCQKSGGTKKDP